MIHFCDPNLPLPQQTDSKFLNEDEDYIPIDREEDEHWGNDWENDFTPNEEVI